MPKEKSVREDLLARLVYLRQLAMAEQASADNARVCGRDDVAKYYDKSAETAFASIRKLNGQLYLTAY